jgi:hypothetical protein
MNEQKFIERVNTSEIVEQTDQGTNSSLEISDYFDDDAPVDAVLIDAALMEKVITYDAPLKHCLTMSNRNNFARAGIRFKESLSMNHVLRSSRRICWYLR